MKKTLTLFALVALLFSCSPDDDFPKYHLETLPIEAVVSIPEEMVLGEEHEIVLKYRRPTTCYGFNNFYYDKDLNVRTVAINAIVQEDNSCVSLADQAIEDLPEVTLRFKPTGNGTYVFKFWTGKDDQGENTFTEYEIPVTG